MRQNTLPVIFSNVAISWAIHEQNLDETLDISNKTTTNMDAGDFCASVSMKDFLRLEGISFDQKEIISHIKVHLDAWVSLHDMLGDALSRDSLFRLLCFFLCPYKEELLHPVVLSNPPMLREDITVSYLEGHRADWMNHRPELGFSFFTGEEDLTKIPLLLAEIDPKQLFSLRIFPVSGERSGYQVVFGAVPQLLSVKVSAPVAEVTEEERTTLNALVEAYSLPKPEKAQAYDPTIPPFHPAPPPLDTISMMREHHRKVLELVETMGELVEHLKASYPDDDPVCTDLMDLMGEGVVSMYNALQRTVEGESKTDVIVSKKEG